MRCERYGSSGERIQGGYRCRRAQQGVGGLAALGLPGGKRGGEIRYRVADIGRRRAQGGAREEWCERSGYRVMTERRGLGGGGYRVGRLAAIRGGALFSPAAAVIGRQ